MYICNGASHTCINKWWHYNWLFPDTVKVFIVLGFSLWVKLKKQIQVKAACLKDTSALTWLVDGVCVYTLITSPVIQHLHLRTCLYIQSSNEVTGDKLAWLFGKRKVEEQQGQMLMKIPLSSFIKTHCVTNVNLKLKPASEMGIW